MDALTLTAACFLAALQWCSGQPQLWLLCKSQEREHILVAGQGDKAPVSPSVPPPLFQPHALTLKVSVHTRLSGGSSYTQSSILCLRR